MSDKSTSDSASRTIKCNKCGAVFKDLPWTPGDLCETCGSNDMAPVLAGISDYAHADRSKAFALEDIRFGRLAQWTGIVTPKQVQWALYQQNQLARSGRPVPDIGSLLMREKIIDRKQYDAILATRRTKLGNKDDLEFGQAAVRLGYLNETQLNDLRKQQQESERSGHNPVPLPLLVVEKRYLQENQVLALLKNAERGGTGLLQRVSSQDSPTAKLSTMDKLVGPKDSPHRSLRVGLALGLPPLLVVVWFFLLSGQGVTAQVQCTNKECMAIGGQPSDSKWPAKCPACGKASVYPMAICRECSNQFAIIGLGYGASCPKCKSSNYVMITSKNRKKEVTEIEKKSKTAPKSVPAQPKRGTGGI